MTKILDNFIKEVKKLGNYLVLKEDKDNFLILGTKISIKLQKEAQGNPFQPHNWVIDKSFYVYFKVIFTDNESKIKEYDYLPTLTLHNSLINPVPVQINNSKYSAERIIRKPATRVYDEFDLMMDIDNFVTKTYLT